MLKADFHMHTRASPCSNMRPEDIVKYSIKAGLDVIAITDHNTTEAVGLVKAAAAGRLTVIPGIELLTPQGEILILNPQREYKGDLIEVCEQAHMDNAIIIAQHPFDSMRKCIGNNINRIMHMITAVEVFNGRTIFQKYNKMAAHFAKEFNLPGLSNSDAHTVYEIGNAYNIFECGPEEVFEALRKGQFNIFSKRSPLWVHGLGRIKI